MIGERGAGHRWRVMLGECSQEDESWGLVSGDVKAGSATPHPAVVRYHVPEWCRARGAVYPLLPESPAVAATLPRETQTKRTATGGAAADKINIDVFGGGVHAHSPLGPVPR